MSSKQKQQAMLRLVGKKKKKFNEALTVPEKHQLKIAKDTLKMNPAMANVMGGMSHKEAKEIIKKLSKKK